MSDDNKTVATTEEVTAKVIEDYGFDPETQGESIEKVTNERIENQKTNSKTIEQKSKYRQQLVDKGIIDPKTFEPIENKPDGDTTINKTKTEQTGLSREETIFFAQGGTEETFKIAKQIADTQGIGILAAKEDEYFKFQVDKAEKEAQVKANQIGASKGGQSGAGHAPKPQGKMTEDEHKAHAAEKYGMR